MSQTQKVLDILNDNNWHCTSQFYASYMADPRTIMSKLKKQGYQLISRWCLSHKHEGNMKEWRLVSGPQMQFYTNQNPLPKPKELHPLAQKFLQDWKVETKKELTL